MYRIRWANVDMVTMERGLYVYNKIWQGGHGHGGERIVHTKPSGSSKGRQVVKKLSV